MKEAYRLISLSGYAFAKYYEAKGKCTYIPMSTALAVGVIGFILAAPFSQLLLKCFPESNWLFLLPVLCLILLMVLVWITSYSWLLTRECWLDDEERILTENALDYERSQKLKQALQSLVTVPVDRHQTLYQQIPGLWQPFRVEHFVSSTVRSEITGNLRLRLDRQEGNANGITIPNLLDASSIVWLQDDVGNTLRIILASPGAVSQLLATMKQLRMKDVQQHSHCYWALCQFQMSDEVLTKPITHTQLIDQLDASCQRKPADRPVVEVYGQQVQDGVVIGTALRVSDELFAFLPDGFFAKFTHTVDEILSQDVKAPEPAEAVYM